MRIPIFPLGTLLVPGLVMPLHIFEPRYLGLVRSLLDRPDPNDREFGLSSLRPASSVEHSGREALFPVGTLARIKEVEDLPDGRMNILVVGTRRYRHVDVDTAEPLAYADVDLLDDPNGGADASLALSAAREFRRYRLTLADVLGIAVHAAHENDGEITDDPFEDSLPDDPALLGHLITAAAVLPIHERAELLAAPDVARRLVMARELLRRECAIIPRLPSLPTLDGTGEGIHGN